MGVLLPLNNVRAIIYYNKLRYADDVVILASTEDTLLALVNIIWHSNIILFICRANILSTFPHVLLPPSLLSTTCHVARLDSASASAICVPDIPVVVRVSRALCSPWNLEVTHFHGVMVDVLCIMLTV